MVRTSTAPNRAARLPVARSAHPFRDRLKGLVSLVLMLGIVGGVPYLLVTLFGPPWPEQMPTRDVLFSELDAQSVLKIIAFFIWVAWAHFVICLLTEIVAERRGRGMSPHVPLGGGSQGLARKLVAGVVLLAGSASVTVPVAQAVTAPSVQTPTSTTVTTGHDLSPSMQVEPASKVLPGVTGVRTNADENGRVVKYTEVKPPEGRNYDCLWDIAERYLGDGRRYKEIYDLNKGKLQPDGKRLSNPDLIYPGWQVRLPADAKGPGVHTVKVNIDEPTKTATKKAVPKKTVTEKRAIPEKKATPETKITPETEERNEPRWFDRDHEAASRVGIGDPAKDPNAKKEKPAPVNREAVPPHGEAGDPADAQPGGTRLPDPVDAPPETESGIDATKAGVFGFGATLLAAGLALALKRRRGWSLGPGPKSAGHRQTEVELRLAADVPTAEFVDNALRHLGALLRQHRQPVPAVVAALIDDKALTLVLAPNEGPHDPPAPWQTVAGGRRWMLRRAYSGDTEIDAPSPYPSLVTVGRNADQSIVLVDLDAAGGIASFGGVTDAARDVVGSLAVELATNPWSEGARVTMVGFGDDLSSLAPSRLRYRGSLDEALNDVTQRTDAQAQACRQHGLDSITKARTEHPDPMLWGPEIVVLSAPPSPEETQKLSSLTADPQHSVGVMVLGDVPIAPWRFVVDEKRQAVCRLLGLEVDAHTIDPGQFADLVALFNAAEADAREKARAEEDRPAYELSTADLSQPAPVEIDLLGPVEVDARGEIDPARLELATEIAAFLASQDYGVHPNVLAGAIWPRGISYELRDAALEHTRRWLGDTAIYADDSGRWTLNRSIVRVDWDVFRTLTRQAATMDDPRGPLSTAMSLVHGPCWSNLPAGRYSWLAASGIERRMAEAVIDTALQLAEASLRYNDGQLARTALQTGLKFAPASEDLWRATLRLASHFGSHDDVTAVANQMYAAIARHGGSRGAEPETDALVDELLPGYRRPRAVA